MKEEGLNLTGICDQVAKEARAWAAEHQLLDSSSDGLVSVQVCIVSETVVMLML